MAKQVSPDDKHLFIALMNGDEVRLDLIDRSEGGKEVAVTLTNGQTIKNCFWTAESDNAAVVDVNKVRKLIKFVHNRNKPAYQRMLNAVRPHFPKWMVDMSGWTMLACYLSIPVFGWLLMPVLGRTTWTVMALYTTLVMIITLGFSEQEMDTDIDFRRLEGAATLMLGAASSVAKA